MEGKRGSQSSEGGREGGERKRRTVGSPSVEESKNQNPGRRIVGPAQEGAFGDVEGCPFFAEETAGKEAGRWCLGEETGLRADGNGGGRGRSIK
jgi:hypothetical protein